MIEIKIGDKVKIPQKLMTYKFIVGTIIDLNQYYTDACGCRWWNVLIDDDNASKMVNGQILPWAEENMTPLSIQTTTTNQEDNNET